MPETLQHAVEHQDEFEAEFEGDVNLSDVLVAVKLLRRGELDGARFPALRRVGVAAGSRERPVMEEFAEELASVRSSLND